MGYVEQQGGKALGARLRRLSEQIDRDATRSYARYDLKFEQRWFGVLNQLRINEQLTVGQLACNLGISHPSVSQTRRSLESNGLVKAARSSNDARERILSLTEKGTALIAKFSPLWEAMDEAALKLANEVEGLLPALEMLEDKLAQQSLYDRISEALGDATDF